MGASVAVIIAIGAKTDGRCEVLGMEFANPRLNQSPTKCLCKPTRRGHRGVKLVGSEAHDGIKLRRKNHLFAGSQGGAQTWTIFASLINTAKLNCVDLQTWLLDGVDRIVSGRRPINRIGELRDWDWKPASAAAAVA